MKLVGFNGRSAAVRPQHKARADKENLGSLKKKSDTHLILCQDTARWTSELVTSGVSQKCSVYLYIYTPIYSESECVILTEKYICYFDGKNMFF